jgi:hypothetical protein
LKAPFNGGHGCGSQTGEGGDIGNPGRRLVVKGFGGRTS